MQSTLLRSFGRRQGRKLKAHQAQLVGTLLPRLMITLPETRLVPEAIFDRAAPLWCEIGFGGGEHLLAQAAAHPEINFIGCEPYMNGMAKLLSAIDAEGLTNIRLYDGDARHLLERLPHGSLNRIFLLFPDPWPKARHHKRRIVSQATLGLFYAKLALGGLLRIATDHEDYAEWIERNIEEYQNFDSDSSGTPPDDWVRTRYQIKAEEEGRSARFWTVVQSKN